MQNNVNTFNSAKMTGAQDPRFQRKYNALIDLLSKQLKVLSVPEGNGITINPDGSLTIGLASTATTGLLTDTDWNTFNGKQDQSNELDALSALADTAGFVKKTGDGAYSIDTSVYLLASALSNAAFSPDWEDDSTHAATKGALYDYLYVLYVSLEGMFGSGEYTEDNYVTDMASVTANIDALDMAVGLTDIWGAM
jgi:hypothetical protein